LFGFGSNQFGQLSRKPEELSHSFNALKIDISSICKSNIISFDVGDNHSIILFGKKKFCRSSRVRVLLLGLSYTKNNNVENNFISFGSNIDGQCGTNGECRSRAMTNITLFEFLQQQQQHSAKKVVCGPNFTIIMISNGTLVSFGFNIHGELASGDNEPKFSPTLMKIVSV
jgi:alpha-tubulin suppressor-like RCC1 family protein